MEQISSVILSVDELFDHLLDSTTLNNTERSQIGQCVEDSKFALQRLADIYQSCTRRRTLERAQHSAGDASQRLGSLSDCGWFTLLPDEVLLLILQYCICNHTQAVLLLPAVCKRFRKLCADELLWKTLYASLWAGWLPSCLRDIDVPWRDRTLHLLRASPSLQRGSAAATTFRHASFGDAVIGLVLTNGAVLCASASGCVRAKRLTDMTLCSATTQSPCTVTCPARVEQRAALCVGATDGRVCLYEEEGARASSAAHACEVTALTSCARLCGAVGSILASAAVDRTVHVWRPLSGAGAGMQLREAEHWLSSLDCDSERLYGVGGPFCCAWDVAIGTRTQCIQSGSDNLVKVAVSSHGSIVAATDVGGVRQWDPRTATVLEWQRDSGERLIEMQVAETLLLLTREQSCTIYDMRCVRLSQPLVTVPSMHASGLSCALFDYAFLLLGHVTGDVSWHDLRLARADDTPLYASRLNQPNVRALSSRGRCVAAADNGGFVRVWTLPT